MPEGHTLHRLARDLDVAFGGRRVRTSSPQGRFAAEAAALDGAVLVQAESGGKHLFVEFVGDRFVHVHLGLIGKFDITAGTAPPAVGAVRLRIEHEDSYADLRGAITCDLVGRARRDQVIGELGPDPLRADADPDRAWDRIRRSDRALGDLLMDQKVLAGVGNVYRAEVLFRHRLDPRRPGRTLRRGQWVEVWEDLVCLLAEGVRTGRIDTVRPEHTPEAMGRPARKDDHGGEVYVYRRDGQRCFVCDSVVRTSDLKGRNLFWCPRCQPTFRSRATKGPSGP
ncbi:endonuclease VIII [Marmoricola endophyticus]|uniref:DNA-(apurinic or apyrimidinic site) lyase n=1 Tax=Marmoricola endophyticus TaxID=2040280 RepID=A0A917BV85_9ACTN|nr:Fpg/Nei family DNA glycosylase [Marmoricola endophyticus]GGF57992.1 endonuclease VIII [Marmoricola endophyticus]